MTLRPDVETPFADGADAIRRLLPYHIWQHPAEDLDALSGKGKGKLKDADALKEEIGGAWAFLPSPVGFHLICRQTTRDSDRTRTR